jgi:polyphosphate glucokinase
VHKHGGLLMDVLAIDVGGTNVKILATGQQEGRKFPSGPKLTAKAMVEEVKKLAEGWNYDAVSIGYPGPVANGKPVAEPHNLAPGWVGFNFERAFGCPVSWTVPSSPWNWPICLTRRLLTRNT